MFRQMAAILLLCAFSMNVFHRTAIVLDYYADTASFARACENKALPAMHCNGKCQMMKKLREEEKKEGENPERKEENKSEITLSSKSFFASIKQPAIFLQTLLLFPQRPDDHSTDRSSDIFHPPQAC